MPPVDQAPSLDTKSFIAGNNGLFAADIAKIPGAVCVPNASGLCGADNIYTTQYLRNGASVAVTFSNDGEAKYDSLIDDKYKPAAVVPFIAAADGEDHLDEIKAFVVEKASITPGPNDGGANGFPGGQAIADGLNKEHHLNIKAGSVIYWITGAQLILVTRDKYAEVPDSFEVTGTGFGGTSATYNAAKPTQPSAWIGIQAVKIIISPPLEASAATAGDHQPAELSATAPTPLPDQIFDVDASGKIKSGHDAAK